MLHRRLKNLNKIHTGSVCSKLVFTDKITRLTNYLRVSKKLLKFEQIKQKRYDCLAVFLVVRITIEKVRTRRT